MDSNTGAIAFVALVVVCLVGFFVWRSMSMAGPAGLSLAEAGAQKQAAVDATATTAASAASSSAAT